PEPLAKSFTPTQLETILKRYPRRRLKPTLLDQTQLAGLGNIYVDESCFAARLRPDRLIKTLTSNEIKKLRREIIRLLKLAILKGGTSTRDYRRSDGRTGGFLPYLKVYGRAGQTCRRCRNMILKTKLAGRGTHFCPHCQK
ncbi:MAG: zinc finger domain-containing protein, partial [Patescibacteria group bacterium]